MKRKSSSRKKLAFVDHAEEGQLQFQTLGSKSSPNQGCLLLSKDMQNKFLSSRSLVFLASPLSSGRTKVSVFITNELISSIDLPILIQLNFCSSMPIIPKQIERSPLDKASYRKTRQNYLFTKRLFLPLLQNKANKGQYTKQQSQNLSKILHIIVIAHFSTSVRDINEDHYLSLIFCSK